MGKVVNIRKGRTRKGRDMVGVDRHTIYFPTFGDPEGKEHVRNKFMVADAMVQLLLVAIARSGIPLDLLDLPGSAKVVKEHVETVTAQDNIQRVYPGDTVVHELVRCLNLVREDLDAKHKKAVAAAQAQAVGRSTHEAQPEPARLH